MVGTVMSQLRRGMIVDVNLDPTQGSETGKIRPCVIVTNDVYNARVPVIQVVPVTEWSDKKARIQTNVAISCRQRHGFHTPLPKTHCLRFTPFLALRPVISTFYTIL
jgi:mRNA interferase MazF